jgi:hypothetical protein
MTTPKRRNKTVKAEHVRAGAALILERTADGEPLYHVEEPLRLTDHDVRLVGRYYWHWGVDYWWEPALRAELMRRIAGELFKRAPGRGVASTGEDPS